MSSNCIMGLLRCSSAAQGAHRVSSAMNGTTAIHSPWKTVGAPYMTITPSRSGKWSCRADRVRSLARLAVAAVLPTHPEYQPRLGLGCWTHHCTRCSACRCAGLRRLGAARNQPREGAAQTCSTANTPRSAPASRFSSRISARAGAIAGERVRVSLHGGARAGRAATPQVEDAHGLAVGVPLLVQVLDRGLEAVHYQPAARRAPRHRRRRGRARAVTAAAPRRHLFVSAAHCFMCLLTTTTVTGRPRLSLPCRKTFFWSSSVRISSCAGAQRPRSPSQARPVGQRGRRQHGMLSAHLQHAAVRHVVSSPLDVCPQAALRLADVVLLGPQPALQVACAERLGLQAPPQVLLCLPGARLPRSQASVGQRLHKQLLPKPASAALA
jgi:hypothetical protein